jgi:hypothetical protein
MLTLFALRFWPAFAHGPFANKDSFRKELGAGLDYHRVAAVEKSKGQIIPPLLRALEQIDADAPMPDVS